MPRLTLSQAVFGLLGFVLGATIDALLSWAAGGTSAQIQRDSLICGGVSLLVGIAIGSHE